MCTQKKKKLVSPKKYPERNLFVCSREARIHIEPHTYKKVRDPSLHLWSFLSKHSLPITHVRTV